MALKRVLLLLVLELVLELKDLFGELLDLLGHLAELLFELLLRLAISVHRLNLLLFELLDQRLLLLLLLLSLLSQVLYLL